MQHSSTTNPTFPSRNTHAPVREFKHRDHVINIFNGTLNGTNPQTHIFPKVYYQQIMAYLPGVPFRDITLADACRMSLRLVRFWLANHHAVPSVNDFYFALCAGKTDIVAFIHNTYLSNLVYQPHMLAKAIESNNLETIRYIEEFASHFDTSTNAVIRRRRKLFDAARYFLREKLLMLKELRKTIGMSYLVPPGETDPETTLCEDTYSTLSFSTSPTVEVVDHVLTSGMPLDISRITCIIKEGVDLTVAKYLYRKLPCAFNNANQVGLWDVMLQSVVRDKPEFIQWLLDLKYDCLGNLDTRCYIGCKIWDFDAINVLRLLDDTLPGGFPYLGFATVSGARYGAVKVFEYYHQRYGFSALELQEIFNNACAITGSPELYFKLVNEHGCVPTAANLHDAVNKRITFAHEDILNSMLHQFHLRPQNPHNIVSLMLTNGINPILNTLLAEQPEVFDDQVIYEVYAYGDTLGYAYDESNVAEAVSAVLNVISITDPIRADRLAARLEGHDNEKWGCLRLL